MNIDQRLNLRRVVRKVKSRHTIAPLALVRRNAFVTIFQFAENFK